MARKATPLTSGRKTRQKVNPDPIAEQTPTDALRRGRKPKLPNQQSAQSSVAEAFFPDSEQATPQPPVAKDGKLTNSPPVEHTELAIGSDLPDVAANKVAPPMDKARRGRPSKAVRSASAEHTRATVSSEPLDPTAGEDADSTPEALPAKARRGQKAKNPPNLQSPATQEDQPAHVVGVNASGGDRDDIGTPASRSSAARWDPVTGTPTFDWPRIEQVAATEGPNQSMAKLLLAARAEGANSRWPF
jgi:hypothetical protein